MLLSASYKSISHPLRADSGKSRMACNVKRGWVSLGIPLCRFSCVSKRLLHLAQRLTISTPKPEVPPPTIAIRFLISGSGEDPSLSLPLPTATTRVLELDLMRSCFVRGPGQITLTAEARIEVMFGDESC